MNYIDLFEITIIVVIIVDISGFIDSIKNLISTLKDNDSATMNNTFNINGTNAKEIASEVSKILQTQVERRAASWA